jgi:hypothetical protein
MAEQSASGQQSGNTLYTELDNEDFVPRVEEAEAKIIPDLPETRPYPLIHHTRPSVAVAAMVDGLHSSASARESGEHILDTDAWQGDRAVSVTDLEGLIQEHELDSATPDPDNSSVRASATDLTPGEKMKAAAEIALGMREATDDERSAIDEGFWNKGGVCLLINPALERYYGGTTAFIPRDQAREKLIGVGQEEGDQIRYGGGFPGEAVVLDQVDPQDINGVLLTSDFTDSNIVDEFNQKVSSFGTAAPESFAYMFHDEVNLLKAFGLLDANMKQASAYVREHDERATKLRNSLASPLSPVSSLREHPEKPSDDFFGEPPTDKEWAEYVQGAFAAEASQQAELASILSDPDLSQHKADLLDAFRTKLEPKLKGANISTYSELIVFLAKARGLPVYDNTGKVIWPDKQS